MVAAGIPDEDLESLLDKHAEWLMVAENGRTFPVNRKEIELEATERGTLFGAVADMGFRSRRIVQFGVDGEEIDLSLAGPFNGDAEILRLVPRVSAAELAANVELARLVRANEIAELVARYEDGVKLVRTALNAGSGRFAEIIAESRSAGRFAVFADIAGGATAESIFASSILWFERFRARAKKPARELHIVAEKRSAANLQRLHALLKAPVRNSIRIFELNRAGGAESLKARAEMTISRLWREKPKKLNLPTAIGPGGTAQRIVRLSPEAIDVMHSRQGETLRFNGMAFARVRMMAGKESAWFGVERARRALSDETWPELVRLVDDLKNYRTADTGSKRHDFYRLSPESWLESILRRNIKLPWVVS